MKKPKLDPLISVITENLVNESDDDDAESTNSKSLSSSGPSISGLEEETAENNESRVSPLASFPGELGSNMMITSAATNGTGLSDGK